MTLRSCILYPMTTEQGSLFDRRKYTGVLPQSYQITPPTANQTVLGTLPAYHAYLIGGDYYKYKPDDFTSDMKRIGLFVGGKALKDIKTVDNKHMIGEVLNTYNDQTDYRNISYIL